MDKKTEHQLSWSDFMKVDMRVGTVIEAEIFEEARKPAYKMKVDFGPLGIKKTSAQITDLYQVEDLIGRQIIAVVNFPPKQIATLMSECLVMGAYGDKKEVILIQPDRKVPNGLKIG